MIYCQRHTFRSTCSIHATLTSCSSSLRMNSTSTSSHTFIVGLCDSSSSNTRASFPLYLTLYRLSLKREPDQVQLRRTTVAAITPLKPGGALRTSKSHEDLLTPFSSGTLDSQTPHPSLETSNSATKVWTPQPHHRALVLRHTLRDNSSREIGKESVRLSAILNDEELNGDIQIKVDSSPEADLKRLSRTLPLRGGSFTNGWPSRDPFQPAPSSSSSSSTTSSKSNVRGSESAGTPVTEFHHFPPPSAPPVVGRNPNESPSQWKRQHRKSYSVGAKWANFSCLVFIVRRCCCCCC